MSSTSFLRLSKIPTLDNYTPSISDLVVLGERFESEKSC